MTGGAANLALVIGASGIAGRWIIDCLLRKQWDVVAVSRSGSRIDGTVPAALDLLDPHASRKALAAFPATTHVFYAGRHPHAVGEPVEENLAMLRNTLESVEAAAPGLRHVHLVHGTKYYGSSTGRFPTPASEEDPRALVPCFYYEQENYVRSRQAGKDWNWSISRPHGLLHARVDSPRNLVTVIVAYALICRELSIPLCFPGAEENYRALYQCTSVDHMADATIWIAQSERCANQAFNITNGDLVRWEKLWPSFARNFGMEPGPVRTMCAAREQYPSDLLICTIGRGAH